MSYDVITPSAARAIFSAILWKPAINWRVTRIEVLNPIRWAAVRRNEVARIASPGGSGIFIEDERQQRAGLLLRDVRYRLHAEFDFIPPEKRTRIRNVRPDEKAAKYAAMFARRATKGQHFMQPYLGCREFSCSLVRLVKTPENEAPPIAESRDLGFMLYDLDYSNEKDIRPMFYRPEMKKGAIDVPPPDSPKVLR